MQTTLPLLLPVALLSVALSTTVSGQQAGDSANGTSTTGSQDYWVDPESRLMWDSEASNSSFDWRGAMKYCRDLRVAGFRDWRLPTIAELEQLRVPGKNTPKGRVNVVAYVWSSTQSKNSREVWIFDFTAGRMSADLRGDGGPFFAFSRHALCVRTPGGEAIKPKPQK
jgi:Protein of unknown function (DUF1566)